ncbi:MULTISPECIES: type II secretion system minor pseudopilin GspK [unclassified Serratia (in: enterobacteria)]|uniref:type II secretion system minor pseudopilin GspK n=1 Tax=unclassified Serratia (in: enterobacteria) TaxID=2647522 RepID=UPI000503B4F7|nr:MULTISPECIES: type II secretion system minor pseudopilin GspK [unclassified Serratia (in: enterobacteria)]KFK91778.1 pullulanase [Serratia sp. Ag2]KFK93142.1 pullulanase [Serratia sp. Ag1]
MRARQKGVALLVVLLILALMVTIAATIAERNGRTYLRTAAQLDHQQAKWYGRAAETLARKILQMDTLDSPEKTHLAQNWAQDERRFPVEGGELHGQIVDAQACFNLNAINQGAGGQDETTTPYPAKVFLQLLKNLQVDPLQAAQVTAALRDWIDSDNEPGIGGAEDEVYMSLDVPYLPANQPMQDVSELRTVYGVDTNLYRLLLPYVCALPTKTLLVNVNTLRESQAPLLAALFLTELDPVEAEQWLQQRPREGWSSVTVFLAQLPRQEIDTTAVKPMLTVKSDFFLANFSVLMGNSHFSQHSLLQRTGNNFHVVQRKYGLSMMVTP